MADNQLFGEADDDSRDFQAGLSFDDGSGLRIVNARFLDEQKFSWDIFDGYNCLQVLTYSASTNAIVRMLDKYSFDSFDCVFGFEGVLRDIKDIFIFSKRRTRVRFTFMLLGNILLMLSFIYYLRRTVKLGCWSALPTCQRELFPVISLRL